MRNYIYIDNNKLCKMESNFGSISNLFLIILRIEWIELSNYF